MIEPLVSILMSVYNSENTLKKSLESILNQTYQNIELLLVDDCSSDKSLNILEKYADRDKRIKLLVNENNIGLTKSLNKLLLHAEGQYIARQDADDISCENRIEFQQNYILKSKNKILTSRALVMHSNRVIPKYSFYLPNSYVINYKNPFIHGTLFMKKSIMDEIGGYDENFYFSQDYKFFSDCYKAGYKVSIINKKLYLLNMENNLSNKFHQEQKYYADCVRKNITPEKF